MMDKKIQIGEVVERSKNLEAMLKKLEAEGRGMHELISSIQEKLEPELNKKLRFIATIRNQAIHEPEFNLESDFEAFCTACEEASQELEKIIKPKRKKRSTAKKNKKTVSKEAGFNYLFLMPFIPGINVIYFLFLLVLSVLSSTKYVIVLMLYLFSFAALTEGIIKNNEEHIVIGTSVFTVLYVYNIFIKPGSLAKLRYIPLLNIALVIANIKNKVYWRLFFIANVFIIMSIASVFLAFYRSQYITGAAIFAAAYTGGIILFIYAGKSKNNTGLR